MVPVSPVSLIDVQTIQVNKAADLNVASQGLTRIEARLAQAFMRRRRAGF